MMRPSLSELPGGDDMNIGESEPEYTCEQCGIGNVRHIVGDVGLCDSCFIKQGRIATLAEAERVIEQWAGVETLHDVNGQRG